MASNYNSLGFQLMTTGEKAGTWGTETNTTWNEVRDMFGYITVAMTADRTLTIPDGSSGTYDGRAMIIECNGALGANRVLDIAVQAGSGSSPGGAANILKPFIVYNNTSTAYTLTFKVTGATGFELTQGKTYLCYHNGTDIINTGLGAGDVTLTGTQTLTNKTLTSPAIGTSILDTNAKELFLLTATTDAVNEFTVANAATTNGPTLSATGESNVDINITPKGTGSLLINPPSTGSLTVSGNSGNAGTIVLGADTDDTGSFNASFAPGVLTESTAYVLPTAYAGTTGDTLQSTDAGVLSWATPAAGGTSWQAVEAGATMTAVAGEGYFINTTSNACTATLPAGTIGDEVNFIDYAGTFDTNNLTVAADGSEKIHGSTDDLTVATERAGFCLVYTDGTQGWLLKDK